VFRAALSMLYKITIHLVSHSITLRLFVIYLYILNALNNVSGYHAPRPQYVLASDTVCNSRSPDNSPIIHFSYLDHVLYIPSPHLNS
jgi:hypothetical protein